MNLSNHTNLHRWSCCQKVLHIGGALLIVGLLFTPPMAKADRTVMGSIEFIQDSYPELEACTAALTAKTGQYGSCAQLKLRQEAIVAMVQNQLGDKPEDDYTSAEAMLVSAAATFTGAAVRPLIGYAFIDAFSN